MPLKMKDEWYEPVEKDLNRYFYDTFFKDIFDLVKKSNIKTNSLNQLISKIQKGEIQYKDGIFTGSFNISISKELSKYAKYDAKSKTWKGVPPSSVVSAASIANSKSENLHKEINNLISEIPAKLEATIKDLKYSVEKTFFEMNKQADKDLINLGVVPELTPEMSNNLIDNYTNNQNLNIVNWEPEQVSRLRELVEKSALKGYNKNNLQTMLINEWGVSQAKAKFLARQENSLYMSKLRNERYVDAGLKYYKWSTSKDIRVVGNPSGLYPNGNKGHGNHWVMQGKICKYDDPTIYADTLEDAKNNKWKSKASIGADNTHPGEAFNDRCVAIPVL